MNCISAELNFEKTVALFKQCTHCGWKWDTRESFLNDESVILVGYLAHFEDLTLGLFLFNHSCKTTLSLEAGLFIDLFSGPVFTEEATGGAECPGFCLKKENIMPCPVKCECAFVREILQVIKQGDDDFYSVKGKPHVGQGLDNPG